MLDVHKKQTNMNYLSSLMTEKGMMKVNTASGRDKLNVDGRTTKYSDGHKGD